MDRRDVLKYTAYLTGYAATAPLTSALLSGCKSEPAVPEFIPSFFTPEEYSSVRLLANTMLPKTNTPGADEVGVPQFVDLVFAKFSEAKDKQKIRSGLNTWLDETAKKEGSAYTKLSADDQLRLLNELDTTSKQTAEELEELDLEDEEAEDKAPWWMDLKSIIIGGYFSSEYVGTEILAYDPIPGSYQGCIPVADIGKAWSL